MNECKWIFSIYHRHYDTECGEKFITCSEEPIILNYGFKFCPFCGKKIKIIEN